MRCTLIFRREGHIIPIQIPEVSIRLFNSVKFKALKHTGGWSAVYCRGHNDPVRFFAVSDIGVPGGRIFGFYLVQTLGNPVLAQKMLYRKYDGAFPQTAFFMRIRKIHGQKLLPKIDGFMMAAALFFISRITVERKNIDVYTAFYPQIAVGILDQVRLSCILAKS